MKHPITVVIPIVIIYLLVTARNADCICFIIPDDAQSTQFCPNTPDPCVSLSQFVSDPTKYVSSNTSFIDLELLPGNHRLQSTLTLKSYSDRSYFAMVGRTSSTGVVVNGGWSANLDFSDISTVIIEHIQFVRFATNKFKSISDELYINNCSFINGNGTALEIEYNERVRISRSKFISNFGTYRQVIQTGLSGKSYSAGGVIFVKDNLDMIFIDKSTFHNNSADVGGIIFANMSLNSLFAGNRNNIVIRGSSFTNNMINYSPADDVNYNDGVVIYCQPGSICDVRVLSSVFERNTNEQGYALFMMRQSSIHIQDSSFSDNQGAIINIENGYQTTVFGSNFSLNINLNRCGGLFTVLNSLLEVRSCNFIENGVIEGNGGVVCAQSSQVIVYDCTFIRNYGGLSGGVFSISYETFLSINRCQFEANKASRDGGVINSHQLSNVTAKNSRFANNTVGREGGVVTIEDGFLTIYDNKFMHNNAHLSGGVFHTVNCKNTITKNLFMHNSAKIGGIIEAFNGDLLIDYCNCTLNNAEEIGGVGSLYTVSTSIMHSNFTNNQAFTGGVFFMKGVTFSHLENAARIIDSIFVSNEATDYGAVLYVDKSLLQINSSLFTNNVALLGVLYFQGCRYVYFRHIKYTSNTGSLFSFNSKVTISGDAQFLTSHNARFTSTPLYKEGGAITSIQSVLQFEDAGANFEKNCAEIGGAMMLSESKVHIHQSLIRIVNNYAVSRGGGIYCFRSELTIQGSITFARNIASDKGGAIHATSATVTLVNGLSPILGSLHIVGNHAVHGGGIYLNANAKFYITKDQSVGDVHNRKTIFVNNSAEWGGAVFIADGTDSEICSAGKFGSQSECAVQVLSFFDYEEGFLNTQTLIFVNNSASHAGSNLFGGLLDRCTTSLFAEVRQKYKKNLTLESEILGLPYLRNISNIHVNTISSEPVKVCFCVNSTQNCSFQHSPIDAKKGESIILEIVAVDQVEYPVSATIRSYLTSEQSGLGEGQLTQYIAAGCSEIAFEVFSPNDSEEVVLYAEGPCKDIGASQRIVEVVFLPCTCPIGFRENKQLSTRCECICDDVISSLSVECDIATNSIIRRSNFWITYVREHGGYIVYPECPFDYCHPPSQPVSINLNVINGVDAQCVHNHVGMLCGSCKPGYSAILGSSKCLPCSNFWLALFLVFALVGVILVVFLLYLNLTVAIGTINGLMFYANVVIANRAIYIPESNFLSVFISWLNLDLGIESCLYDGMDNYVKVWLRFLFPLYIIVLVVLIIVTSEHYGKFAKLLTYKNPVATLATLILLSYTQLLRTIISVVSFAILEYPDGSKKVVWLPDASIEYFSGKHVPLFLIALLIVAIGLLYTVVLFSWQWLLQSSDRKILRWTRYTKLNAFMDAYHAPYNPKYRYWTGLLLFARIILYLEASILQNIFADPRINLVLITVLITGICIFRSYVKVSSLYKNRLIDILELTYYFNIILYTVATLYVRGTGRDDQNIVAIVSISITFVTFVATVSYHGYAHFFVRIALSRRIIARVWQRRWPHRPCTSTNIEEYQLYDYATVLEPTSTVIERFE